MPVTLILPLPELVHHLALLPVVWLAVLRLVGRDHDRAWWWIAGAFGVSWVADTAAHWVAPWIISVVYPVSQTAILGAVFLSRPAARWLLLALVTIGLAAVLWHGIGSPDLLLRTAAWAAIVGIVAPLTGLGVLRWSLLVSFGLGLLAWFVYVLAPGWPSWGLYQGIRAAGLVLFGLAAWKPVTLRLVR